MPYTVVFLWISASAAEAAASPRARVEDLRDFGAARGLSLVEVSLLEPELGATGTGSARGGRRLPARDDALADRIEGELEQARTALAALEESAAGERLQRVEAELLAHPHLPQAAFLMAECFALQAEAARAHDPDLARRLDQKRAALEGPRAVAFGESRPADVGAAPNREVAISGLGANDVLEMDGARVATSASVMVAPGLHHFRVWRAGEPVLAVFSELAAGQRELVLQPPPTAACSSLDLERARGGAVPAGIACASWARVRVEGNGIGVSLCQHSQCGPFVHWQRRPEPAPFQPIKVERGLPTWAGFTIIGAAAVLTTGLVLWQSGALDRGQRSTTTLEYRGLQPQALRF